MKDNILGFDVISKDYNSILDGIFFDLKNKKQNFIVNINPFIIMNFHKNKEIIDIFNKEKYQIPDGIGVVWASKYNKKIIKKRIAGIDLMMDICEKSSEESKTIFLCGSADGVAERTKIELEKKHRNINITGFCDGYITEEEMLKKINKSKADIVFVALGSPRQEEFIIKNRDNFKYAKILMPVGGSFDVISGNIKRAPEFFINTHTEWLYRMLREPKRIKKNLLLVKFIFLVILKRT